jgi:hypothetical protein
MDPTTCLSCAVVQPIQAEHFAQLAIEHAGGQPALDEGQAEAVGIRLARRLSLKPVVNTRLLSLEHGAAKVPKKSRWAVLTRHRLKNGIPNQLRRMRRNPANQYYKKHCCNAKSLDWPNSHSALKKVTMTMSVLK